jgi:hypothetical protein
VQDHALLDGPFPRGGLVRGISDGTVLLGDDAQLRGLELTRISDAGARTVRIPVNWRDVVIAAPPRGFDARDPASPAYRFARIDSAVDGAVSAGLTPLLVVSHAPDFAEAPHRWPYAYPGSWAPSPAALESFAAALARRYDGAFPDPLLPGHALGRVRMLQAWNEPNLPRYLEPQWVAQNGRWSAFSPLLYRQLLNAFYTGVKSVQPTDLVVAAGLAPNGEPDGVGRMAPVRFLRALLCLAPGGPAVRAGRPTKGPTPRPIRRSTPRAVRRATARNRVSCQDPPSFDVLAFHPLSVGSPDIPAVSSLDVAISDAGKITALLRRAERLHTALPVREKPGGKPVWVTELNWESPSAKSTGVPESRQAKWISRALHRLWIAGVTLVDWQFLIDPYPGVRASAPTGATIEYPRPAGLYSAGPGGDARGALPKAFLRGFAFPFDPLRVDARRVRVWALLGRPGQPVLLQHQGRQSRLRRQGHPSLWRTVARLHAGRNGVLNVLVSLAGGARLRLQSGALGSTPMSVPRDRSRL